MATPYFRIESSHSMVGPFLPHSGAAELFLASRATAIVVAAKSNTKPYGQEIRVVYVPTGEVVFRKTASALTAFND